MGWLLRPVEANFRAEIEFAWVDFDRGLCHTTTDAAQDCSDRRRVSVRRVPAQTAVRQTLRICCTSPGRSTLSEWAALMVGGLIVLFGAVMILMHVVVWRRQRADTSIDGKERAFLHRRYRRRMQTSSMVALIGLLIPVGDQLPILKREAGLFAAYWVLILLASVWMGCQALADLISTHTHSKAALLRVQQQQRELQQELSRLQTLQRKGQHGKNGRGAG